MIELESKIKELERQILKPKEDHSMGGILKRRYDEPLTLREEVEYLESQLDRIQIQFDEYLNRSLLRRVKGWFNKS